MAEAAFKQMIAACIRQTRPQTFRHGKPPRYPQRFVHTAAIPQPHPVSEQSPPQWQAHTMTEVPSRAPQSTRLQELRNESEPRSFSSFLTDNYSREHNYLRISLTERCNLRCVYCMPEEGIQLSPPDHILTTPEIVYLASLFVQQGVDKIRLTGGEPTVRKDILDLMRQIGNLRSDGLKELCLTTNGISLHRKLDSMLDSGLTGVNLSLDTLDPFQFTIMTRRNGHDAVMKSVNRILEMNQLGAGIKLKINCVVMRGLNDKEILPFVELGRDKDLEVRFIEYMPFDGNKWSKKKMLGFQEMLALIRQKYPEVQKVQDLVNDTSKTYKIPGFAGRIGFITSMTHNFCGTCNRLRITSDGNLKVCLFGNSEVSLRDVLRESNHGKPIDTEAMEAIKQFESGRRQAISGDSGVLSVSEREAKLLNIIGAAVKRKKEKHAGMGALENMKNRPMILIDDGFHTATDLPVNPFPPILRSPPLISAAHSNAILSRSAPLHILSRNLKTLALQQHRYCSTLSTRRTYTTDRSLKRYVLTSPIFRRIETDRTQPVNTRRNVERTAQVKKSLDQAVRAIRSRARFGTASSARLDDALAKKSHSLSHLTSTGAAHMINVGQKKETHRSATAVSYLLFSSPLTYNALKNASLRKGDAIAVARIAAIQAAKKTADIIPLAHPGLGITGINVEIESFPAKPNDKTRKTTSNNDSDDDDKSKTSKPEATTLELVPLRSIYGCVIVQATVECYGKTGVEMEALTAANVGVLTMYDMLKGIDKTMLITGSRVLEKRGGKSGSWRWNRHERRATKFDGNITSAAVVEELLHSSPASTVKSEHVPASTSTSGSQHDLHSFTDDNQADLEDYVDINADADTLGDTDTNTAMDADADANTIADTDVDADMDANTILQSEWTTLSTSFSSTPSLSTTSRATSTTPSSSSSSTTTTEPQFPDPTQIRSFIGGDAFDRVDAAGFRAARVERFEEWRRNR